MHKCFAFVWHALKLNGDVCSSATYFDANSSLKSYHAQWAKKSIKNVQFIKLQRQFNADVISQDKKVASLDDQKMQIFVQVRYKYFKNLINAYHITFLKSRSFHFLKNL